MVATLQSRREALEAKIKQKNEELKKICMQEADLTGVIPPEIPLEPGEPPPQLRRRIGTSFSYPQNLLNQIGNTEDESLTALEVECKVQTNIAEAALTLANDSTASKHLRRKHRLMYRQSQRRLMELETRLTLLRQGKSQNIKQQHAKKKPRPVSNSESSFTSSGDQYIKNYYNTNDSWALKTLPTYTGDETDNVQDISVLHNHRYGSLQRSRRSSATSKSSGSPRIDRSSVEDIRGSNHSYHTSGVPQTSLSYSQPNIQGITTEEMKPPDRSNPRRPVRRGTVSGVAWETMSSGGTLLPSQTYPDHSHHPNLNRAQSLGSVETNAQQKTWSQEEPKKEKEWYESSLDSAPSPPIRTSSRLPPAMRILQNLKEAHMKDSTYNPGLRTHLPYPTTNSHPVLHRTTPTQYDPSITHYMNELSLNNARERSKSMYVEQSPPVIPQSEQEYLINAFEQESFKVVRSPHIQEYSRPPSTNLGEREIRTRNQITEPFQNAQNIKHVDNTHVIKSDAVVINIPEEYTEYLNTFMNVEITENAPKKIDRQTPTIPNKPPTQAYYHTHVHPHPKPLEPDLHPTVPALPNQHPLHAVAPNDIVFDSVVPFESPQNHTVVQAGKWQPYREVTKPFEMSDFYKYSTKFRQSKTPVPEPFRAQTPLDFQRNSPAMVSPTHQKVIYQPLRPMTCQPLNPGEQLRQRNYSDESAEISKPEIV